MGNIDWIEVIDFVWKLIKQGMDRDDAAEKVANKFGVSKSDILKKI